MFLNNWFNNCAFIFGKMSFGDWFFFLFWRKSFLFPLHLWNCAITAYWFFVFSLRVCVYVFICLSDCLCLFVCLSLFFGFPLFPPSSLFPSFSFPFCCFFSLSPYPSLPLQSKLPFASHKRHPSQHHPGSLRQLQLPQVPFQEPELYESRQHPQPGQLCQPGGSVRPQGVESEWGDDGGAEGKIWSLSLHLHQIRYGSVMLSH